MKRNIFKSALVLAAANIMLRSLGFLREVVLANTYGANVITDAFVIASTIPGTVLAFLSASVSSMYIPLYQRHKERKDIFTSNLVNLLVIVGLVFSLVFTAFPRPLVYLFGARLAPETFALAAAMLRIMVWSAVPILLAEIFRGFLQVHNIFFRAAISGAAVNLCLILAIAGSGVLHIPTLMGVGSVVGNAICLIILFFSARKQGLAYRPYINPFDDDVKELARLIAPVILVSAMSEVNQIVDRNFASTLATGSISSLNYAYKFIALITTLTGMALATVLFPQMSEAAAENDTPALKKILTGCTRTLIPVLLPLAAGAILLAEPVIRVLLERNAFTPEDTIRTAECLQMYALCLIGNSINALLVRVLYAIKRTKAPAAVSAFSIGINILLNFLLIGPLRHRGLALSTGIASIVSTLLLLFVLRRTMGHLGLRSEGKEIAKTLLATAVMAGVVWVMYRALQPMAGSAMRCALVAAALAFTGAVLYVGAHAVLRTAFFKDGVRQLRAFVPGFGRSKKG